VKDIAPTIAPGRHKRVIAPVVAGLALLLLALAAPARALELQTLAHFAQPIHLASDPYDPERLLVAERAGRVMEIRDGVVTTFLDLRPQVGCCAGESGLLSIAPAPDFAATGRLYAYYTDEGKGDGAEGSIHVVEARPGAAPRDLIPPVPHPGAGNHYGGQLQVGPDGALYAGLGDGGIDPLQAQEQESLLGKIVRIAHPEAPLPTAEVHAVGLRNPFRFSFDRATGELLIGDVGESDWEEVNVVPAGPSGEPPNFGWPCFEGPELRSDTGPCAVDPSAFAPPLFAYPHDDAGFGTRRGIIGGHVVRDPSIGDLRGRYLYGDLATGEVRSFNPADPGGTDRWEGVVVPGLYSFGEDACGRLYALSGQGAVHRLVDRVAARCRPPAAPGPQAKPSYIRIRAANRKVKRRKRALISVWVSPCDGRRGEPVTLWRGARRVGFRRLNRACSAHFRPRIVRRSNFRARVPGNEEYLPAVSRKITIRPVRKLPRSRRLGPFRIPR